jgi:hypothetical protein
MPFSGQIIGIGVRSNAAYTRGASTFDITINGTKQGQRVSLNQQVNSQNSTASFVDRTTNRGSIAISAGDRIGVAMDSDVIAPTGADVVVTVIVSQDPQ